MLVAPSVEAAPAEAEAAAPADDSVPVLVLRVGGTGSASSAQTYIDALMDVAARVNGWSGARGKYFTSIKLAKGWVAAEKPHFGILSLVAYLSMRKQHKLSPVGTVQAAAAGGKQFYLISSTAIDLTGCKGKTLATNLGADAKFIDAVVAGSAFSLADFEVVHTRRPVQTIKKVIRGEAQCALIDDAQIGAMSKLEGGEALQTVWFSPKLPSLIVTRFADASDAETTAFAANLPKICTGDGAKACGAAGIDALDAAPADGLDALVAKYDG